MTQQELLIRQELRRYLKAIRANGISVEDLQEWQAREQSALAAWRECTTETARQQVEIISTRCEVRRRALEILQPK